MPEINTEENKSTIPTPKELLLRYLPFLPWIILSLVVCLALAWVKLRYSSPIYVVYGKVLVKNDNPYDNNNGKFSNLFGMPDDNTNLNNEIEIIKSRFISARVIRSLGLEQQYAIKGKILTSDAHQTDIPFNWYIQSISDSSRGYILNIKIQDDYRFAINDDTVSYNFGQLVDLKSIKFRLLPKEGSHFSRIVPDQQYVLTWQSADRLSSSLGGSLKVVQQEGASIINLSYSVQNMKKGIDIVNQFMKEYQQSGMEDKKLMAYNTLEFIDKQLDTLKQELGGVEKNLQRFREDNQVFDPELQSTQTFTTITETQKQLTDLGVKLKVLDYLRTYLNDPRNKERLVPSNLGLEEPSLVQQVTAFNELQLKRETALKTTTAENPTIKSIEVAIGKIKQDIDQNLKNMRNALVLSYNELSGVNKEADKAIRTMPGKEKQLLEVTRRQAILQELYSFLLQKKLETAISRASTVSDIKILEPALSNGIPSSPNKKELYTIAIFLGLAIPAGLIFLLEVLNDKVVSRSDIEKITSAPILGEVGHVDNARSLVVKENNRSYIAEQFRIIRSNLQYILPKNEKPVILVTSSFSGEGKSFISTNLGAVMALTGKKTVILEMDIRKPKILKGLGMQERRGITNYIVSDINVNEIIYPVQGVENMFVIPCGPVPPNPAEMLLDSKVKELFDELKKKFDAIIIDSAPIGLVSDAISLGNYANSAVYIIRHKYTTKKHVFLADELYNSKKLPQLSVIINDIQVKGGYRSYYGYGYGYGSAYGYGYGHKAGNNGYFEANNQQQSISKRMMEFFGIKR
ncbi:GumC family protein [Flavihumibacter profundi]|uniref:GumC family protein n=1 Tax=Flavihumibacter profundi TaxID=2716883 RepID=UPI001CC76CB2|nr:polysaccharide biosynthesis tyrosine autokinase [Flavihumibacter profundi]MBZ5857984.1 polysaccharide biosynthesis tyrosine autokinase [Flavihumibacter profundi]